MSYIGRGLDKISNVETLNAITFDGSTTYALTKGSPAVAYTPVSASSLLVSIDGVIQSGNFSVSTTNIVFDFSPTSSNTNNFIRHYGVGVSLTPSDDSVTNAKIADDAIDSEHYVDGSIDAAHIASDAVTTAKILDDNVTAAKMADNSVDSDAYVDGSIDAAHIASDAVTTAKILDDNVTAAKMADNSVDSDSYVDASIDNAHLADNAVDTAEIADDAVTLAKMDGLARGKIIYGDSSGNPAALTVGSNTQVLKSDGTDIAWAADAGFDVSTITGATALGATPAGTDEFILSDAGTLKRMDYDYIKGVHKNYWFARHANPQSIAEAVSTKITMLTTIDPDSLVSSSTWTCPTTGNWFFFYCLSFMNTTHMQQASAKVYINGSSVDRHQTVLMSSTDTQNQFSLGSSLITALNANDTIEMYALCEAQNNTATTSVKTDSACLFGGWRLP